MSDWRKRGKKTDEVIYFPATSEDALESVRQAYVWDLDKTYLDTKFETFRGLWRTAVENATDKKNVPGTAELVCNLQAAWKESHSASEPFPLFFITASPPQLEVKICNKFEIDGVKPFGLFCKDNFQNLRPRRLWRITKHVGFKLQALLQMRSYLSDDVELVMFGDDGESDAIIYSLFSDICARRLNSEEIRKVLSHFSVLDEQIDNLLRLQDLFPARDPVKNVYINLAEDTDADYYLKFGRRILPTYNSFQMALDLFQEGTLHAKHVIHTGAALIKSYKYTQDQLAWSFDDLVRRQRLSFETVETLQPQLLAAGILTIDYTPSMAARTKNEIDHSFDPWILERIEYLQDWR